MGAMGSSDSRRILLQICAGVVVEDTRNSGIDLCWSLQLPGHDTSYDIRISICRELSPSEARAARPQGCSGSRRVETVRRPLGSHTLAAPVFILAKSSASTTGVACHGPPTRGPARRALSLIVPTYPLSALRMYSPPLCSFSYVRHSVPRGTPRHLRPPQPLYKRYHPSSTLFLFLRSYVVLVAGV